jgi:general secretion pathway protein D
MTDTRWAAGGAHGAQATGRSIRTRSTAASRWGALTVLLSLSASMLAPAGGSAQVGPPGEPVNLDFQDLDLAYVLSALATAAGINVLYHDLPQKPITLRTAQPIPRSEIPALIRSIAAANRVAVVEEGNFMRFVGTGDFEQDPRQIYFYRLRHARAAVLSQTLSALFGQGGGGGGGGTGLPPTLGQQLRELQAPPAVVQQTPQGIVIQGGPGFTGTVLIVPDEVTNTLLIRATPGDWAIIEQAVQGLDLRPLQVVIEVVIAEVRRSEALDVGTSFRAVRETEGGFGVVELPPSPLTPPDALTVTVAHFGDVDIEATLAALAADGDVRIRSRPVVLAQNNQQARILVGSQQPFVQFSQLVPGDPTGTPFQTVQYREVGTVLTILPTINEDGYVNLAVSQEVSSATAETQFGAPVISTREAETQLLARNGQTVVLGGLIDEQVDKVNSGIPFLKDIPLLGLLFGSIRERTANSELFLFLTPYIVSSDEDADAFRQRLEEQRDMLAPFLPTEPITPPVIVPDTLAPPPPPPVPDTLNPGGGRSR